MYAKIPESALTVPDKCISLNLLKVLPTSNPDLPGIKLTEGPTCVELIVNTGSSVEAAPKNLIEVPQICNVEELIKLIFKVLDVIAPKLANPDTLIVPVIIVSARIPKTGVAVYGDFIKEKTVEPPIKRLKPLLVVKLSVNLSSLVLYFIE